MTTMSMQHAENWAKRRTRDERADARGDGAGGAAAAPMTDREKRITRLRTLARLLDSSVKIPGVDARIGLDPVLGLIPGVGDLLSCALSLYIVHEAKQLGASRSQLAAMLANVAIDTAAGFVPVVGDIFDFAFKANVRNLRIIGIDPVGTGFRIDLDPK